MKTYGFWRDRTRGTIWAVALVEGVVVGSCGPLTRSEADEQFLPTLDYSAEQRAVVEGSRERFEVFDPVVALR